MQACCNCSQLSCNCWILRARRLTCCRVCLLLTPLEGRGSWIEDLKGPAPFPSPHWLTRIQGKKWLLIGSPNELRSVNAEHPPLSHPPNKRQRNRLDLILQNPSHHLHSLLHATNSNQINNNSNNNLGNPHRSHASKIRQQNELNRSTPIRQEAFSDSIMCKTRVSVLHNCLSYLQN